MKQILADVPCGSIVKVDGRWGVVCQKPFGASKWATRVVDFWDGGREYIKDTAVVVVAPNKRGVAA